MKQEVRKGGEDGIEKWCLRRFGRRFAGFWAGIRESQAVCVGGKCGGREMEREIEVEG